MTRRFLCKADLDPFMLDLLNSGIRVVAPVRKKEQGREWIGGHPFQKILEPAVRFQGKQRIRYSRLRQERLSRFRKTMKMEFFRRC